MDPRPSTDRSTPGAKGRNMANKRRRARQEGKGKGKAGATAGRGNGSTVGAGGESYSSLGKLVSKATKPTPEAGYKHLDEDTVRRIKAIARQDDHCAEGSIRYLLQRMTAKSAEVRYMALSIVGLLFQRSRVVRAVVVGDLKNFMNLAVGHDAQQPLPGPPSAAAALRQKALALMDEWNEAHGDIHKGLRAAYRFLREGKRMKFPELQARAAREREESTARREKQAQRLLRAKYYQAKGEIEEQAPDIDTLLREMRECFDILVPAVPGTDAIASAGDINSSLDTCSAFPAPSSAFTRDAPSGEELDRGEGGCGDSSVVVSPADRQGSAAYSMESGDGGGGARKSVFPPRPTERRDRPSDGGSRATGSHRADDGICDGRCGATEVDAEDGVLERGQEEGKAHRPGEVDYDSDDAEGMEWEDGDNDATSGKEEEEDEVEDDCGSGKQARVEGTGALRTVADTVEAAGLGTSGYELQVEVPVGWGLTTVAASNDAALVTSALRERYKVLTRRLLPLVSEWIQTLSRVCFNDDQDNSATGGQSINTKTNANPSSSRGSGGSRGGSDPLHGTVHPHAAERRACALLLGRCLAVRVAANSVVSKYVELRIDGHGLGGAGPGTSLGEAINNISTGANAGARSIVKDSRLVTLKRGGRRGFGRAARDTSRSNVPETTTGTKKARLHIRLDLDGARKREGRDGGQGEMNDLFQ